MRVALTNERASLLRVLSAVRTHLVSMIIDKRWQRQYLLSAFIRRLEGDAMELFGYVVVMIRLTNT